MDLPESHAGGQIGLPKNSETRRQVQGISLLNVATSGSSRLSTNLLVRNNAQPHFNQAPLRPPPLLRELTRQCEGSQEGDDDVCSSVDLDEDEDSEGSPHESDLDFVASDEDAEESCDLEEKSQLDLSMNDDSIPRPSAPGLSQVVFQGTAPGTTSSASVGTCSGMPQPLVAQAREDLLSSATPVSGPLPIPPTLPVTSSHLHPCMRSHPTTLGDCLTFRPSKLTSLGSAGASSASAVSDSTLCHALLYEHLARTHSLSCPVVHRAAI